MDAARVGSALAQLQEKGGCGMAVPDYGNPVPRRHAGAFRR